MSEAALRPCPFCGSRELELFALTADHAWVECRSCKAFGPSEADARHIRAWNERPEPSDWLALADRLKALLGVPLDQIEPFVGDLDTSPISLCNELGPCPFCGGLHGRVRDGPMDYASCWSCSAKGPPAAGMREAEAAWNTRVGQSNEELAAWSAASDLQRTWPPIERTSDCGQALD